MANRLAQETSPYLLQHANNPVDWYAWGPDALARAKAEDKPILLSIGYAACHWCHVMEHESFEDDATAALMNERFVNIKVDREERPDLDGIYMQAVQAMTGHGGWPMTVFLTPAGEPFYGGTYFPKEDRHGMPSFRRILLAVSDAYQNKKDDIARSAASVRELYASAAAETQSAGPLTPELFERAYRALAQRFDTENGGFEGAPKFPPTMALDFLLRHWARGGPDTARDMVVETFRHMARGGIYDQVGGGFSRYTVDAIWLVPHFEKMLYDNALLVRLGAHLWQATHEDDVRRVTEETIEWVAREMTSDEGGFFSSYDADSEGHEGKFYLWDEPELDILLGEDGTAIKAYWGVTAGGNFEGRNILHVAGDPNDVSPEILRRAKHILYGVRKQRVWPGLDDKILASWNGWMLRGIAEAARAFDRADFRALAMRNADFLFTHLVRDRRVLRSYKGGTARIQGYLEDHASVGLAAIAMYELTFDESWVEHARQLGASMIDWFWDDATGAFYDTAADHETLITRPRDVADNAVPSGTSLAVDLLARLAELHNDAEVRRRATYVLETLAPAMTRYPNAFGYLLGVADMVVYGATELAIVGDPTSASFRALDRAAAERYLPSLVVAGGPPSDTTKIALLEARPARDGKATAYLCRGYSCDEPVTSAAELAAQIDRIRSASNPIQNPVDVR